MIEFIIVSVFMFVYGLYTIILKKNLIKSLIGIVLLTESSHLIFIGLNPTSSLSQYFVLTSIIISGCVFATILGLLISVYRKEGKLDVDILDID